MAPRRRAALTEAHTKRPGGVGGERSQNAKGSKGDAALGGFFIFIFFISIFYKKIYFRFENLQKYTPATRLPGGRHLAAPLPGGRGFSAKSFAENRK